MPAGGGRHALPAPTDWPAPGSRAGELGYRRLPGQRTPGPSGLAGVAVRALVTLRSARSSINRAGGGLSRPGERSRAPRSIEAHPSIVSGWGGGGGGGAEHGCALSAGGVCGDAPAGGKQRSLGSHAHSPTEERLRRRACHRVAPRQDRGYFFGSAPGGLRLQGSHTLAPSPWHRGQSGRSQARLSKELHAGGALCRGMLRRRHRGGMVGLDGPHPDEEQGTFGESPAAAVRRDQGDVRSVGGEASTG